MYGYKEPSLQDRQAIARKAKEKALAYMRAKPAVDPAELAFRLERQAKKDEALAIKRADAQFALATENEARKADAAMKIQQAEARAARDLNSSMPATLEKLKAARDQRYAARKARKGK
jgi:hypothetical protein